MKPTETTTSDSTGNNTVLAVSGNNQTAQRLAFEYMQRQFIDYGDLNMQAENQIMQAFYNGYLAACANGAVDKTVSDGLYCGCVIPNRKSTANWCMTCNKMIHA